MSGPPLLATLALLAAHSAAFAVDPINEGTLTLVNEANFNSINISIQVPLLGHDSETSNLSGTVHAKLAIDPGTNSNSELTLSEGAISASDVHFNISNFFGSVVLGSANLGGTVHTTTPPGAADPLASTFDAALHEFLINQGTISGTAVGSPINFDLASTPFSGTGNGTGNITLTRKPDSSTRARYDVTVILPLNFSDQIPTGVLLLGSEIVATVTISGTLKAAGQVSVPLSDYLAWTETQGIPGAPPETDANLNGVSNGITWALGLQNTDDPRPHLLRPDPAAPRGFLLPLPGTGSAGPLTVEVSPDLSPGSWAPAGGADLSTGTNPLPAGTAGTVTILPSTSPQRFLRLRANP